MSRLTGNWYTDPMGEFYDWKRYYQLYDEQQRCSNNCNDATIKKESEEEKYNRQLAEIKNDAINRIADWMIDNQLIQYKIIYEKNESYGKKQIIAWADGGVVPIIKKELEQYITTSPNKNQIQLTPSLKDVQEYKQGIGTGVDFNTRKNNPIYINRDIIKSKADDITRQLLEHEHRKSVGKPVKHQLSQNIIDTLAKNEEYETIECNKNIRPVHWSFYH